MNITMKHRMLNILKNKLIVITFLLLSSCYSKTTKEMINIIDEKMKNRSEDFEYINSWIDKQNYNTPYFLDRIRYKQIVDISPWSETQFLDDTVFKKKTYSFIDEEGFFNIVVYQDSNKKILA